MLMRRAFSLVELALVLVVIGLMAVFGLQAFQGTNGQDCLATTQEQLHRIDAALQNFIATNARLPKPARLDLGSSSPSYGYETQGAITDPLDANYATDVPANVTAVSGVLIGAVPHATLGLAASLATDCWGSKFTYAVTNVLTSSNTTAGYPGNAVGAITLIGGTLASPQLQSSSLSYVIVSHGDDKYGATPQATADGTARNCNGSSEPRIDRENCNSDTVFFASTRNTGETDQHFDDLVQFGAKIQSREPCEASVQSWLTNCSGNSLLLAHGATASVSNAAPGYTGAVTVTCTDGTLSQSAPTCAVGGATCVAGWSDVYIFTQEGYLGDCTATASSMGDCTAGQGGNTASTTGNTSRCSTGISGGGPCDVQARQCGCIADGGDYTSSYVQPSPQLCCNPDTDSNGQCGTQAAACTSTTYQWGGTITACGSCGPMGGLPVCEGPPGATCSITGQMCGPGSPNNKVCAGPTKCSVSVPAMAEGDVAVLPNSAPGYSGNVRVQCTGGVLGYSSQSCSTGAPSCGGTDCDASGMMFEDSCSGCEPHGTIHKTYGTGCRRYRCNSGVWQDIGSGSPCALAASCS